MAVRLVVTVAVRAVAVRAQSVVLPLGQQEPMVALELLHLSLAHLQLVLGEEEADLMPAPLRVQEAVEVAEMVGSTLMVRQEHLTQAAAAAALEA